MDEKSKLSSMIEYLLVGGSVFAMHFGGSSMIWPMTWGKESGTSIYLAFLGVFITAIGLVYVGYLALANSGKTIHQMAQDVSINYGYIFSSMTILVMGPLFLVPRMSAASWEGILSLTHYQPTSFIPVACFSIAYYLITYWFICDKNGIIDKLSKVLLPVLIIAVIGIIVKGVLFPVGPQYPPTYTINPFGYGFKSGYATGDVICALLFGNIIIEGLRAKGIAETHLNKNLKLVCIIGLAILTFTHFGHMYTGSHAGKLGELKYAALYTEVVVILWGKVGGIIFNIALMFAALTTAVGASAATAEILSELSKSKINYKKSAIIILIISTIVSAMGLGTIVNVIGPLNNIIYPPAIVMILYYSIIRNLTPKIRLGYRFAMIVALLCGVLEEMVTYGKYFKINVSSLEKFLSYIPFSNFGLVWIVPVAVAILLGTLIGRSK